MDTNNNYYTQFILQQQEYITHQQQFLERCLLKMKEASKLKALEDEIQLLKMKLNHSMANSNKQNAKLLLQINILKKENLILARKVNKLMLEDSIFDEASHMEENPEAQGETLQVETELPQVEIETPQVQAKMSDVDP